MFGIGTGELLLLLVIALIVLGPERMPQVARDIGKVMNDLRRTSDELQQELLNADRPAPPAEPLPGASRAIEATVRSEEPATPAAVPASGASDTGATQADVVTPAAPAEPAETEFDREARLARERLEDNERAKRAAAEGWTTPKDEAGTSDRTS